MPSSAGFIVGHSRDRDFYQVALALEEVGALRLLVTDYYDDPGSLLSRIVMRRIASRRYKVPIDPAHTRNCWPSVALQVLHEIDPNPKKEWLAASDVLLARALRRAARRNPDADLLIYHNYALEAFAAPAAAGRRKHLFVYHPHHRLIHDILQADYERFGIGAQSIREEAGQAARAVRFEREIDLADTLLCASSLTRRSLRHAGFDKPTTVVPYGTVGGRIGFRPARAAGTRCASCSSARPSSARGCTTC